ncbi:MAG: (d)CMP kinase [Limnobacter sp.]|nr:(d)CMP kinase [Limnobacter sp.]
MSTELSNHSLDTLPPVIAIDGPTASGKGTIAAQVAAALGYHYLDSGAIYRVLAVAAIQANLDPDTAAHLSKLEVLAGDLPVRFEAEKVFLGKMDVSESIRSEEAGVMASRLAVIPSLRSLLLQRQRDFRQAPGLVADGRDMGSVVFPDAQVKIFLTASAEVRAERRFKQLQGRGLSPDYSQLVADLQARDKRDSERAVAPLKPCKDSKVLDCSQRSIDEVVNTVLSWSKGT